MTNNKITKKDRFATLAEIVAKSDSKEKEALQAFIANEIALLEKKSSKSKATKTQKENVEIMEKIKTVLRNMDKPVTVTELMRTDELNEFSNQKLTALLKKLVEAGEVVKVQEKKKSFFSIE